MTLILIIGVALLLIVVLICVVLLIPVCLKIDTDKGLYTVYQPGVFSVHVIPLKELKLEFRIAGIKLKLNKSERKQNGKTDMKRQEKRENKTPSLAAWRSLIRKVVKAVTIQKFEVDIDTDNFPLNAKLVPLFNFVNGGPYRLNVNFSGRNYLGIEATVRPITVAIAYMQFLTKQ